MPFSLALRRTSLVVVCACFCSFGWGSWAHADDTPGGHTQEKPKPQPSDQPKPGPSPEPSDIPIPKPPKIYGHDLDNVKLIVWINAFIDKNAPDTVSVPTGRDYEEYKDDTIILFPRAPLPKMTGATLEPYGFLTDNRHYSDKLEGITQRMRSLKGFVWDAGPAAQVPGPPHQEYAYQHTGTTVGFFYTLTGHLTGGPNSKYEVKTGRAKTDDMKWENFKPKQGEFTIDIDAKAANPLVTGSPNIEYKGTFTVTTGCPITVDFKGKVTRYPWFEIYALRLGNHTPTKILLAAPEPGATPASLLDKVVLKPAETSKPVEVPCGN